MTIEEKTIVQRVKELTSGRTFIWEELQERGCTIYICKYKGSIFEFKAANPNLSLIIDYTLEIYNEWNPLYELLQEIQCQSAPKSPQYNRSVHMQEVLSKLTT